MTAHGPHSLGGFRGKGKRHRGDHRPAKKSSGGTTGAMTVIALLLVTVPTAAIVTTVGYIAYGYLAG